MLTRDIADNENIHFTGSLITGDVGDFATVTCRDGVKFTGDVGDFVKITCSGTPTFTGDVGDYVEITCRGIPIFTSDVGDFVKVNGVPYHASSKAKKQTQTQTITFYHGDHKKPRYNSTMIVGGQIFKEEAPKQGRQRQMSGVTTGGKFYKYVDRIPSEGVIEFVDGNDVATKYKGNFISFENGQLLIDGKRLHDCKINTDKKPKSSYQAMQATFSSASNEKKLTPEERFLLDCSPEMEVYIKSFQGKKSHTDILKELNPPLSDTERCQFIDCEDNYGNIINRPVLLKASARSKGTIFDFSEVIKMSGQFSIDPKLVEPWQNTVDEFNTTLQAVFEARANKVTVSTPVPSEDDAPEEAVGPESEIELRASGGPAF